MNNITRLFRHYKNKPYKYLGVVRHSETLEEMALYETLYENELGRLWVRPKDMFFGNIELNGIKRSRFEKIKFTFEVSEVFPEQEFPRIKEIYHQCFGTELNEAKFRAKIQAHSRYLFLSAFEGETLVGFKIGYARDSELFYSWIGAVASDYQNLGLASEMLKMQQQWCLDQGFKKIETRTRNRFTDMIRLNFKFGFKITGVLADQQDDLKIVFQKKL